MAAPLSRSWYNSLVDDTGDGVSGTVWNKAQVDALMDAVDASLVNVVDRAGNPAATQVASFGDGDTLVGYPSATLEPTEGHLGLSGGYPGVSLIDTGAPAGQQLVRVVNYGNALYFNSDAGALMSLQRNGQLQPTGGVYLTNGALQFPATAAPSANPNTMDEYREGVWTPAFGGTGGGSGSVYAIQQGTYTKQGREVDAYGWLHMAVGGSFTPGPIFIFNLPFPCGAMPGTVNFSTFYFNQPLASLMGEVIANATYAALSYVPAAGGTATLGLPHTAIVAEANCKFHVNYQAAQ